MLSSLIIALSMYSVIPMPQVEWKEDNMRWSLGFLPVVGVVCTLLVGGWSALTLHFAASPVFFAALAVMTSVSAINTRKTMIDRICMIYPFLEYVLITRSS